MSDHAYTRKALKDIVSIDGVTNGPWSATVFYRRVVGYDCRRGWTEIARVNSGHAQEGPAPDAIHIAACDPFTMREIDALVDAQDAQIAELLEALIEAEALISGELTGSEWKRACHAFVRKARTATAKAEGKRHD